MNYRTFLKEAAHKKFEPLKLDSGVTKGFIKPEPSYEEQTLPDRNHLGTDYALKYRLQEHDQQEDEEVNYLDEVEGLTSISGTIPNPDEVFGDQLTEIYEIYPFDNCTDKSNLVIHDYKDEILENIESNAVVLIKGQTGCGKSTQVPQMILDNGRKSNTHCNIVVTQPRRIAAISLANRVAAERKWGIGTIVGYQISLERKASADTRLLYCTTGVLLQQIIKEQSLTRYTHIIVDEVHERDMETDFLLILLKRFLKSQMCRTKIILMSATVNTEQFTDYFARKIQGFHIEPPVIEMSNSFNNHPVSIYYLEDLEVAKLPLKIPMVKYEEPKISNSMMELAASLVEVFHTIDQYEYGGSFIGSVLIFLPGYHEICDMHDCLTKRKFRNKSNEDWILLPLHSSVTFDEQTSVFRPPSPKSRKIILATNIAESSITVPDIKYVIDFCLMKYQRQEIDSGFSSLQCGWMSKSQGTQRAGRVGRVMPGRVYRLISKSLFEVLSKECEPEIKRSPLDVLVLKSKQLDADAPPAKILAFAMDPPDLSNIQRTVLTLKQAGGLTTYVNGEYVEDDGELTYIGQVMASLPIDISLSKLIIVGHQLSLLKDAIIIASAMSVRSIFSTPFKQELEAYNSRIAWADNSCSDPIAFKIAYEVWRRKTSGGFYHRSGGLKEKDLADRYFIQIKSLKEVSRLEEDITRRLKLLNITEQNNPFVKWSDSVKPLILKMMIAGAFYPNYFLRRPVDEREAVKILGGRDPFNSCYLSGFPLNQPGPLYAESIKNYFTHCGSDINVSFDGSSKVYLEFGSSTTDIDSLDKPAKMPGCIQMALYRAVKLRQLKKAITIPLLHYNEAQKKWAALGQARSKEEETEDGLKGTEKTKSNLPGHTVEILAVNISHKENPSKFWVQIADEANQLRLGRMFHLLNSGTRAGLVPMQKKLEIGMLVAAPYSENVKGSTSYFRARIKNFRSGNAVQVFFIDYGNTEWVDVDGLMDFHSSLVKSNITEDPEIAMECSLTEIQPSVMSNRNGMWLEKAVSEFDKYFGNYADPVAIAKVYSVVNGVVSVMLFRNRGPSNALYEFQDSFNYHLIKKGFADRCEEPYLSRENHLLRVSAKMRPDLAQVFLSESSHSSNYVKPPRESDCIGKVVLKGPKSPLEMGLYCLTQKCISKHVTIDWTSVNSVLLDTYPMDPHERILVAGCVNQSANGENLILRHTSLMPNIHGLTAIIALLFSPNVELRVDAERTRWTGVLCGLGCDPNDHRSYDPENDMEINFDVVFTYEDLENVNKLRYWMNLMLFGGMDWRKEISKGQPLEVQEKIQDLLTKLLLKKRPTQGVMGHSDHFKWGLVDEKWLLCPMEDDEEADKPSLYPLIWAVRLKKSSNLARAEVSKNIDQLQAIINGLEQLRSSTTCELCHVPLDDVQAVRFHLTSSMHREALFEHNKTNSRN